MNSLIELYKTGEKLCLVTAYDAFSAACGKDSGADALLVGDSLGMVVQGKSNTIAVTLEEICYHSEIVKRIAQNMPVIADLPFLSYESSTSEAFSSAKKLIKESGVDSLKLEGGGEEHCKTIKALVRAGIPIIGHIGLKPQQILIHGSYKVVGKTKEDKKQVMKEAIALEKAGVWGIIIEAVPPDLAHEVTKTVSIPTIGIGASADCDGQILVFHDLLGMSTNSDVRLPKFVKKYVDLRDVALSGVKSFVTEVKKGDFPQKSHHY